MKNRIKVFFALWVACAAGVSAQDKNSSIFMNASSDSAPREVSLGLPTNTSNCVPIYEDGLPVSYYIYHLYPFKAWHGGVSAASTGSMGPMETSMRYGEINNYVDSYNRIGSSRFRGSAAYNINIYGQNKLDLNISGPFGKGWGYSLSVYQNFDPGSNHTVTPVFKDRHQFYKGVISKEFLDGRGKMSLVYQYVNYMTIQENFGPFVFVGDGSVKEHEGFNLGHDSYRPEITSFSFMDFKTGEIRSMDFENGNRDKTHHVTFNFDYDLGQGYHIDVRSRFKTGTSVKGAGTLSGIEDISADKGYTYADGTPFTGKLQRRMILHFDTFGTDWMTNAEMQLRRGRHKVRAGLDYQFNHGGTISSSVNYAHEVKAKPAFLYFNGADYYNYNTAGEFYDGFENKLAAYAKEDWNFFPGMDLSAFLRLEYLNIRGDSANNIGDDKSNTRYPGFNLTKGKITHFGQNFLNGAAGLDLSIRIYKGLFFKAQGIFTRVHSNIFNYGGFYDPSTAPTDTRFVQAGLSYINDWVNLTSQMVYISQSNYNTRSVFQHALQKEVAGYPVGFMESVTMPLTYGIESIGWVTDAIFTPVQGLNIHVNFTLRDPKYKNFHFAPTFSDGVTEEYDFSGNNVTNLHKVEFTVDPSYSYRQWRFWLTARYIGKQFINKTNSLYFKGRVETFGGVDFRLNDHFKFSLNLINILNQKGASGQISSADLVVDASGYKNYLMSGTFIRPFTVELGVLVDF